jgi:hypothetical protein
MIQSQPSDCGVLKLTPLSRGNSSAATAVCPAGRSGAKASGETAQARIKSSIQVERRRFIIQVEGELKLKKEPSALAELESQT